MDYEVHYYDLVLAGIIGSVGVGAGVGFATTLSMAPTVIVSGAVAAVLVGHALFVNGPVDEVEDLAEEVEPEEVPGVAALAQVGQ